MILFKLVVTAAGFALTYIPFLVLDDFKPLLGGGYLTQIIFIIYCAIIIISIWWYKPELMNNDQSVIINETGPFI